MHDLALIDLFTVDKITVKDFRSVILLIDLFKVDKITVKDFRSVILGQI